MLSKTHVRRRVKGTPGMRLVEVLWWDAQAKAIEWEEKVNNDAIMTCSVGYVLHDTDTALTIAAIVNENHIGHALTIPYGCIEEVRDLTWS